MYCNELPHNLRKCSIVIEYEEDEEDEEDCSIQPSNSREQVPSTSTAGKYMYKPPL
jgi:hypothetical protein